eukprot:XP_534464.3 ankyrin repeat domain-containing protein 60 [Canis lupus familiaris]
MGFSQMEKASSRGIGSALHQVHVSPVLSVFISTFVPRRIRGHSQNWRVLWGPADPHEERRAQLCPGFHWPEAPNSANPVLQGAQEAEDQRGPARFGDLESSPEASAARAPGQGGQGGVAAPQAPSPALDLAPDTFVMRVLLEDTGETFQVANCRGDMTVRELKEELDLLVGVPLDLQRLQYLDQGVLMDDATLKFHDVVPGGIISLCIWHYDGWTELVLAAVEGDPSKLSCLGVDEDSLYRTANSQHYERKQCKAWIAQRAFVALYVTSHRGHPDAVQYLLEHGANCLSKTPMGRTALHVAAAMGRLDCINHLLDYGASIHEKDARGETPMSIARRMNRKHSERRMFLFYWMSRLGTKDPKNLIKNKVFLRAKSGFGSKKSPV